MVIMIRMHFPIQVRMFFERIVFIKETESLSLTWKQSNIEHHMTQHRNKYLPEDIYQS
jgi:hypothetical protein